MKIHTSDNAADMLTKPITKLKLSKCLELIGFNLPEKGPTKGLVPTLAREVPRNAVVFGVHEMLKQHFAGGRDTSNLGRESLIVAGGVSGAAFWLAVNPTNVIKSVILMDDFKKPKFSGVIDVFRKIMALEGVKGLLDCHGS
ncbi:mitochondrial carnitine/acylcarnitine carrier-like protein [Benincasa hispida]|uniref:mitochondrial carnitine/acylcarnitine carrier-like protein n=1 Tax=Benincasa hispida TaxID=102211 RepID=UPI001901EC37|nr:mitochondrial carnitine/acylcarnitine carrier-like protein [Benincasa hispida]